MEYENTTSFIPCCVANDTVKLNSTYDFPYHRSPFFNALGCLSTLIIAFAAIFGNAAVVISNFWDEALHVQMGNRLIIYLSCTDILTAIFVMLPSALAVAMDYWPLGFVGCKVNSFFNYMLTCSSSVCIAMMSVDRAIAVAYPLKYLNIFTDQVMFGFLGWLFIQGTVMGTICGALKGCSYDYSEGVCVIDYTASNTQTVYDIFTSGCSASYFVPVGIISVCSFMISAANRSKKKKIAQPLFVRRWQCDIHLNETIKSMTVVVVTYYICFSPYALSKLLKVLLRVDMPPWLNYMATISIFIGSATNPIIYAILRKDYRHAFKRFPILWSERTC